MRIKDVGIVLGHYCRTQSAQALGRRGIGDASPVAFQEEEHMLYNPGWSKQAIDPFSLDTLVEWLKKKHPRAKYVYHSCSDCMLAQYFKDHGYSDAILSNHQLIYDNGFNRRLLPPHFDWIAYQRPHRFCYALERAIAARDVEAKHGKFEHPL
jgi:hypothetical protein